MCINNAYVVMLIYYLLDLYYHPILLMVWCTFFAYIQKTSSHTTCLPELGFVRKGDTPVEGNDVGAGDVRMRRRIRTPSLLAAHACREKWMKVWRVRRNPGLPRLCGPLWHCVIVCGRTPLNGVVV